MNILVLNCGSSSVKYKLFNMEDRSVLARGLGERIGMPGSKLRHQAGERGFVIERPLPGHREAVEMIIYLITHADHGVVEDVRKIQAVGHRVVHGGESFQQPVAVDEEVLKSLDECSKLAPLHNPPNIMGIRVCRKLMSHALQVAVFDTAFHQTMPDYAYMYALPFEFYKVYRVRKYGFHGASHKYVARRAAEISGCRIEELKIITCHLGNGASLCAVRGGRSLDTTMGFTPLSGLVMGTRCGDVDPAVIPYIAKREGVSTAELLEVLNKKSGVLGISGVSSDFRDLERAAGAGHDRARLALDMFVYSVTKGIGALISTLGGLDMLVFTAGVGENSPVIRSRVCLNLKYMGISLDEQKNSIGGVEVEISTPGSAVRVLVIPTDEERMIAEETNSVIERKSNKLVYYSEYLKCN